MNNDEISIVPKYNEFMIPHYPFINKGLCLKIKIIYKGVLVIERKHEQL